MTGPTYRTVIEDNKFRRACVTCNEKFKGITHKHVDCVLNRIFNLTKGDSQKLKALAVELKIAYANERVHRLALDAIERFLASK